jgi:hypothetical protein
MRKHYGPEETIHGKREEQFRAHRRKVVEPAPWDQRVGPSSSPSPTPSPGERGPILPQKPACFGRDRLLKTLIQAMLAPEPLPIPILGEPGIGKSTLVKSALYDSSVVKRFGPCRYFVQCDSAFSANALASKVLQTLGMEPQAPLDQLLLSELARVAPAVLVLDNAETPWDGEDKLATEELFAAIAGVARTVLIVTMRGKEQPGRTRWREPIEVPLLKPADCRRAFLELAGQKYRQDPNLDRLMRAVDYLPLAITQLAFQARGEGPDLASLWKRWQQKGTALLKRARTK